MKIGKTPLKGGLILQPSVFEDHRGYFFESFNQKLLEESLGYSPQFVQDNQSKSTYGVLRGLHLQLGELAQAKLVRAIEGEILDIIVDVRPDSDQFGQYFSMILSAENKNQLFIPRGFAHGFAVLTKTATIHYKADNYYNKEAESGLLYNDPEMNIDWQIPADKIITSEKDLLLPTLAQFKQRLLS